MTTPHTLSARRTVTKLIPLACFALAAITAPSSAAPVGLYEFEGNGDDSSGFGNDATSLTAGFVPGGVQGQAADFTPNQFVELPLNINPGVAPRVTIGAWVNVDVVGTRGTILSSDNGGFDRGLNIDDRDGGGGTGTSTYSTFTGSGGVLPGTPASPADGFVFVAATYNQLTGQVDLNVDGSTFSRAATSGVSDTITRVGLRPANNEPLDGQVDNVFFFNTALSSSEVEAIRSGGSTAALSAGVGPGQMWSADLQVGPGGIFGSANPLTNPGIGNGDVWNDLQIDAVMGVNPVPNPASNPSFNLVDSTGAASPVTFSITGDVSGFNNGDASNPISTDYFFWGISGTSSSIGFELSGLTPGAEYEFAAFGGAISPARAFDMRVDTDADGDLSDEIAQSVTNGGLIPGTIFTSVIADASGRIIGDGVSSGEANWGGFQLRLVQDNTSIIPEPATLISMLGLGLLGLRRQRR